MRTGLPKARGQRESSASSPVEGGTQNPRDRAITESFRSVAGFTHRTLAVQLPFAYG